MLYTAQGGHSILIPSQAKDRGHTSASLSAMLKYLNSYTLRAHEAASEQHTRHDGASASPSPKSPQYVHATVVGGLNRPWQARNDPAPRPHAIVADTLLDALSRAHLRSLLDAITRSQSRTLCFFRNFFVRYLRYLTSSSTSRQQYIAAVLSALLATQLTFS